MRPILGGGAQINNLDLDATKKWRTGRFCRQEVTVVAGVPF